MTAQVPNHGKHPSPPARSAGFSMIELMVVLTIVGIMLAAAIPNFARVSNRDKVMEVACDIQRTLTLARQKALAKRAPYRVTIDPISRTFRVDRHQMGAWVGDPPEVFAWREEVDISMSVGGVAGNYDIEIEPQGTLRAQDAPALLTFTNCHGDTVVVNFVRTGRIRVRS